MHRIIGVTDLQRRFRTILDEVVGEHVPYVLTRGSRPEAAIIPYEEFMQFLAWKEQDGLYEFDRVMVRLAGQNTAQSDDEVAADAEAAVREVRARYSLQYENPLARVTADPRVLVGKPVIRGMRISVAQIVAAVAAGVPQSELLEDYPGLEPDDIQAALLYAANLVEQERVYPVLQPA
jgi:prevent-host-death family protein